MHKVVSTGQASHQQARINELEYDLKQVMRRFKYERGVWIVVNLLLTLYLVLPV